MTTRAATPRWTLVLGFLTGLGLGCSTAAVVAQGDDPPSEPARAQPASATTDPPAAVVTADAAEVRYAPNGKATAYLYATGREAFIGRLEMVGGAKVPEHQDPTEEYIYITKGSGEMFIDDVPYTVGPDTAIYMPAGAKVRFENGAEPLSGIQIFANPGPEAKYQKWSATKP